jgi:hypothetical protein
VSDYETEYDGDASFDEGESIYYDSVEELASADNLAPGTVTSRFFDETGAPRTEPGPGSSADLWFSWADALPQENPDAVSPADYPEPELSPEAWALDYQARQEAQQAAGQAAYEQGLFDRVAQIGRTPEYGITSPDQIAEAVGKVDAAMRQQFAAWLAEGHSAFQAGQATQDVNIDGAIGQALGEARYDAITGHTKMAQWRRSQADNAAVAARFGQAPQRSIYESPSIQRMERTLQNWVDRTEAHKQFFRDRGWA